MWQNKGFLKNIPKIPRIRFFFSILAVLLLSIPTANAAGYTCPSYKTYTKCASGYYLNGTTAGNSCSLCSGLGNGTYTQSAANNSGGTGACYRSCTRACTQQTCPTSAYSCSHGSTSTSGTQYYGGTCSAAASTCSLTINSCKNGYYKNGNACASCSSLGDGTYTSSADGTTGGTSACWKSCSNYSVTNGTMVANASKAYYSNACTYTLSCNSGYHVSGSSCASDYISVACDPGKYIKSGATTCAETCPAGSYCEGGTFSILYTGAAANTGITNTCTSGAGSSYPNSADGSVSVNDCYRACVYTDVPGGVYGPNGAVSGKYYYGETAESNSCLAGWCGEGYYMNPRGYGKCYSCPDDYPYTPTYDDEGEGFTCRRSCTTSDVSNASAVSGLISKDASYNACAATSCNAGYYLNANACTSCTTVSATDVTDTQTETVTGGTRTRKRTCTGNHTSGAGGTNAATACTGCSSWGDWGTWTYTCTGNYELNSAGTGCALKCTATNNTTSTQSCTTTAINAGTQTCNGTYTSSGTTSCSGCSSYGSCVASTCNSGYYLTGGACNSCADDYPNFPYSPGGTYGWSYCYRECVASDVENATAVASGGRRYSNNNGNTCKATACATGYYLKDNKCEPCPSGYTSDNGNTGGVNSCYLTTTAGRYIDTENSATQVTCLENHYCPAGTVNYGNTGVIEPCTDEFPYSATGRPHYGWCYRACVVSDVANATAIEAGGVRFSDNSGNTCKASACESGYYLKDGTCRRCADDYPEFPLSPGGTYGWSYCYRECVASDVENATAVASGGRRYSNNNGNTCKATACNVGGYYLTDGKCNSCATDYPEFPNHPGGARGWDYCYRECVVSDVANATAIGANGRRYADNVGNSCVATACAGGYYVSENKCPACSDLDSGTYPNSADGNSGGASACYKNCTNACTQPVADCPANSSCTYTSTTTSGKWYYGADACNAAASTCEITGYTCNTGYNKNFAGTCAQTCTAGITTLRAGTNIVVPLYASKQTTPAINIKTASGNICYANLSSGSASGAINVKHNDITYHTVQ